MSQPLSAAEIETARAVFARVDVLAQATHDAARGALRLRGASVYGLGGDLLAPRAARTVRR